jgi:AAA+ ATPase superfamily predicted ATPase
MTHIAGREHEIGLMKKMLDSPEAGLLAMYGRRRIGKTFLIEQVYGQNIIFALTGLHRASLREQLTNFAISLSEQTNANTNKVPRNWLIAFKELKTFLAKQSKDVKQVIFFDEFPWLDGKRSGFLAAFEHFWNSWASKQPHLLVVICGSAASWMIKKVIRNKGGLYNRITQNIRLLPFTLAETAIFLKQRNISLSPYEITQLYMCMGGVPHYLKEVGAGMSAAQIIDKLAFKKDGLLTKEFQFLYKALFENSENHETIVRALATKRSGLTRQQLVSLLPMASGGSLTTWLYDLEESGFIEKYRPFNKIQKEALYRLTDEYSLFYLKFIEGSGRTSEVNWLSLSNTPQWKSWAGYAFEGICLKHTQAIKKAMGISGLTTTQSSWILKGSGHKQGAQIDMLIDRPDNTINLIEIKFAQASFTLTKNDATDIRNKIQTFIEDTQTRKNVFCCMITPYGVAKNEHYLGLVQQQFILEDLFGKE